ncbi:hypothetical protein OIU78_015650 [Salix suchowensis]|nr:hypothetical protein OIU78_015650 [Salix suchowensis]
MKKFVLKVDLHDDKAKQKAFRTVSTLTDVDMNSRYRAQIVHTTVTTHKLAMKNLASEEYRFYKIFLGNCFVKNQYVLSK